MVNKRIGSTHGLVSEKHLSFSLSPPSSFFHPKIFFSLCLIPSCIKRNFFYPLKCIFCWDTNHSFCSGSLVPDDADTEQTGLYYDPKELKPGDIPPAPSDRNATYLVNLDSVPSGKHRLTIYAHNGVGWSQPLKDPSLVVQVINHGSMTRISTLSTLLSSLLLPTLLTLILWNNH